jgi:hypothetical protein
MNQRCSRETGAAEKSSGVERLRVSVTGRARVAARWVRAAAMQREISAGETRGRAPSWTATWVVPGETADGFFEVGEVEGGEAVGRADEDDFVDFGGGEEGVDAAAEDGGAEEGGGEFVEAHAAAGSGGDEDGGEFQGWERILGIGDLRLGKKGRLGSGIGDLKLDLWGREGCGRERNKEGRKKRGWGGIPTGTVGTFFQRMVQKPFWVEPVRWRFRLWAWRTRA